MPATPPAPPSQRVQFAPVEGAAALFTPEFQAYLLRLHDELGARVHALRAKRDERLVRALQHGRLPSAPASSAGAGDWKVPPVPEDLRQARHRDLGARARSPACSSTRSTPGRRASGPRATSTTTRTRPATG